MCLQKALACSSASSKSKLALLQGGALLLLPCSRLGRQRGLCSLHCRSSRHFLLWEGGRRQSTQSSTAQRVADIHMVQGWEQGR
jgi:hypothetical protein